MFKTTQNYENVKQIKVFEIVDNLGNEGVAVDINGKVYAMPIAAAVDLQGYIGIALQNINKRRVGS